MKKTVLLSLLALLFFLVPRSSSAVVAGEGNIQCDCFVTTQLRGGDPVVQEPIQLRGDSESSIDGGLCQEFRSRIIEALTTAGGTIADSNQELRNCRNLTETGTPAPTSATPDERARTPESYGYNNPLGTTSVNTVISRVIRVAIGTIGALFFAMFVWGGVLWMTAGGEAERVKKAKQALFNAFIGMAVVVFSYTIINVLFGIAGALTG